MNSKNQKPIPRGIAENILFHIIRTLYICFAVSRACVYKTYRFFNPPIAAPIEKLPPNYDEIYKKYINIYATPEKNPEANINIDCDLYDYEKRKMIFKEEKNECEEHWKRKLMYEFTSRGNVIIYYNPYKHAFMYYSDENSIPYNIMQYIAKKYAVMFRCRDFYIDPVTYPNNRILEVMKKEEDALKTKPKKVGDITKCLDKDMNMNNKDIFATLKSYKQEPDKNQKQPSNVSKKQPNNVSVKNQFSNTFIRLGKTCEYNIIQKPPDKNIAIVNSILFGEKNIGNVMDYFEHLEIEENPFNTQDLAEPLVKSLNEPLNEPLDKPLVKSLDTDNKDLYKPLNQPLKIDNDNTPVKSWKDFKNRMNS